MKVFVEKGANIKRKFKLDKKSVKSKNLAFLLL